MKVLQVLPSYAVDWGGPPKVVKEITDGLKDQFDITILTTHQSNEVINSVPDNIKFITFKRDFFSGIWISHSWKLRTWLKNNLHNYQVVHLHELWGYTTIKTAQYASKLNIPYIISPHGELDIWALSHKQLKKRIFTFLFQRKVFQKASVIHALTEAEQNDVYKYEHNQIPVVIIPNSINVITNQHKQEDSDRSTAPYEQPYILFLSRIHEKKGCHLLIEAYKQWEHCNEYALVLAGPFEGAEYEDKLRKLARELPDKGNIIFTGTLQGEKKAAAFNNASLFVLPSFSEGFPIVLLEALMAGCPLLISRNCGIHNMLQGEGVALLCNPEVNSIKDGLNSWVSQKNIIGEKASVKGPDIVKRNFSTSVVCHQFDSLYKSITE